MLEERIVKAINFFRRFSNKSDRLIYRKSVLKFCDLVEEFINGKPEEPVITEETIEEKISVFDNLKESGGASS